MIRILDRCSEEEKVTETKFEKCIRQMNQGDQEGLREVYEEYVSYIFGIVMQVIHNRENAEDITSDFFIKLWEKSALYKPGSGHRGWMATIARNMTVDFIRKHKREELTAGFTGGEEDAEERNGYTELQQAMASESTGGAVSGYFRASEVEDQVIRDVVISEALNTLNEKERTIVHMKVMGDLTFKEISAVLDIPMGTVAWRYREAMNKLRGCGYEQGL